MFRHIKFNKKYLITAFFTAKATLHTLNKNTVADDKSMSKGKKASLFLRYIYF